MNKVSVASFNLLTTELQNVLMYQHEVFVKSVYFVGLLIFSLIYLFYFRPKREKTPFFSVVIVRLFMDAISIVYLITTPILVLLFDPNYAGLDFIFIYFILYTICLSLYLLMVGMDIFRYGIPYMLRMGDIKWDDPKTKLAYQKIDRWFKNGLK